MLNKRFQSVLLFSVLMTSLVATPAFSRGGAELLMKGPSYQSRAKRIEKSKDSKMAKEGELEKVQASPVVEVKDAKHFDTESERQKIEGAKGIQARLNVVGQPMKLYSGMRAKSIASKHDHQALMIEVFERESKNEKNSESLRKANAELKAEYELKQVDVAGDFKVHADRISHIEQSKAKRAYYKENVKPKVKAAEHRLRDMEKANKLMKKMGELEKDLAESKARHSAKGSWINHRRALSDAKDLEKATIQLNALLRIIDDRSPLDPAGSDRAFHQEDEAIGSVDLDESKVSLGATKAQ